MTAARSHPVLRRALLAAGTLGAAWCVLLLAGGVHLAPAGPFTGAAFALLALSAPVAAWIVRPALRWRVPLVVLALLLVGPVGLGWAWWAAGPLRGASQSSGRTADGSLAGARALAPWGRGHVTCSPIVSAAGRQHAHSAVVSAVTEGLAVAAERTGRRFVVAETGWPGGGDFRPHRTHRNGLSVDLMVPLIGEEGRPVRAWHPPWQWFGYRWELDERGRRGRSRIDWPALARALQAVERAAAERGLSIERAYLAPELQPLLLEAADDDALAGYDGRWNARGAWWRHDEHVHLDFRLGP